PLFHFGLVFVVAGHVLGLIIPDEWTAALGVTETRYHYVAYVLAASPASAPSWGIAILLYRRRTKGPVFMATTRNDKMMYLVLVATICAGLWTTVAANSLHQATTTARPSGPGSAACFILQPEIHLIASAPLTYQVHALIGIVLFILWPFTDSSMPSARR
ncbi:respiratory nitrate reductase subunit gamma, partial [Rhodococcus hoagii]|nr:respiratory nitrate reductase subunit gamma [Prescottella equi]